MNHKELVDAVADRINMPKEHVSRLLDVAIEAITARLLDGNTVGVQGFGTFEVRKKGERVSVHPLTQVRTLIPPKLAVNFKQSTVLKDKLKELPHD